MIEQATDQATGPLTVAEIRELVAEVADAPTADRWLSYAMQMPKYRRVLATLQQAEELRAEVERLRTETDYLRAKLCRLNTEPMRIPG